MSTNHLDAALNLARALERSAVELFSRTGFRPKGATDLAVFAMAVRSLGLFQGVIRCASEPLPDAASSVARSLLEQLFALAGVARAPNEVEKHRRWKRLEEASHSGRVKAINKLMNMAKEERSDRVTDELLARAKASIPAGARPLSAEQMARWAGKHGLYQTAYTSLSFHVHPSVIALDEMFGSRDGRVEITAKPYIEALPRTILTSIDALLDALRCLPAGCLSPSDEVAIDHFTAASTKEWTLLPDQELTEARV